MEVRVGQVWRVPDSGNEYLIVRTGPHNHEGKILRICNPAFQSAEVGEIVTVTRGAMAELSWQCIRDVDGSMWFPLGVPDG